MVIQGLVFAEVQFYLSLPIANTLNATSPLFVFIIDYYINGVTINRRQLLGIMLSAIGVVLTINGAQLMFYVDESYVLTSDFHNYTSNDPKVMTIAGVIMVMTMMFHGYGVVMTKKLVNTNSIQINYFLGVEIILTSAFAFPIRTEGTSLDLKTYLLAFPLCGLPMTIGQLLYIGAIGLTKHYGAITIVSFVSIIFGYCVSMIRYNESVNPICVFGSFCIIAGLISVIMCKEVLPLTT